MESFVAQYPEIVKAAITEATEKINAQTKIRDMAADKVMSLRAIDTGSPYSSIGSDAGRAEIALNIEEAALRFEFENLGLIYKWAPAYIDYIKNHNDIYMFEQFHTFFNVYIAVNRNHVERLIRDHRFECKCQFFGYENNGRPGEHYYVNGEETCSRGVLVHLSNIKSAINKVGFIGCHDPEYIYPVPNTYID
jgi:hypothetical protein